MKIVLIYCVLFEFFKGVLTKNVNSYIIYVNNLTEEIIMADNKLNVIVIGAGSRGRAYTDIMADLPEKFKVVGIVIYAYN